MRAAGRATQGPTSRAAHKRRTRSRPSSPEVCPEGRRPPSSGTVAGVTVDAPRPQVGQVGQPRCPPVAQRPRKSEGDFGGAGGVGGDHLGPDAGLVRDEPAENIQAVTLCEPRALMPGPAGDAPLVSPLLHVGRYGVARRLAATSPSETGAGQAGCLVYPCTCVRPQIPGLSPGGLGPHLTSSGLPFRRSSGFPSSALRFFPFVRLPLVSLRPASSGSFPSAVTVRFRSPFGFPPGFLSLEQPRR